MPDQEGRLRTLSSSLEAPPTRRAGRSWRDLSYIDNWSMVGDIVIIAKTLRAVFQHHGAYQMGCRVKSASSSGTYLFSSKEQL